MDFKFDYDDITLVPSELSDINSRQEIKLYRSGEDFLSHLMTAPMDTVCNDFKSAEKFRQRGITTVLPRGAGFIKWETFKGKYVFSITLGQMEDILHSSFSIGEIGNIQYICLDIANGHMKRLIDIIHRFKKKFPHIKLMVGNIGNPTTFRKLSLAGADSIRVGIGAGSGCLTSEQTSVNYPMASLVKECRDIKKRSIKNNEPVADIIADGGIRKYADIIKALNLGADYVMIGGLFNKMVESSPKSYAFKHIPVSRKFTEKYYDKIPIYKKFRGMSTKEAQLNYGREDWNLRTSEGVVKYNRVKDDLKKWCENYEHYLRSAMSYSDSKTLDDFIGKQNFIKITSNSYKRFNK